MVDIRGISTNRWWHKKKNWWLFIFLLFLFFVRISKGSLYKDFYYLISKPFWPGQFQREVLTKSVDQEFLIRIRQLQKDNKRLREILSLQRLSDSETILLHSLCTICSLSSFSLSTILVPSAISAIGFTSVAFSMKSLVMSDLVPCNRMSPV